MTARLVAVKGKLYHGIFPSERHFEVVLANGDTHRGLAPRFFCWNDAGKIVAEDEATDGVDGAIAAKRIAYDEHLPPGIIVIEVPDGNVLAVTENTVLPRPTTIHPPGVAICER